MEFKHISVLWSETIEALNIKADGVYADGTLGAGGHSSGIAERLESGHLYGFDQDPEAIEAAGERLSQYTDRVTLIRDNFENMTSSLERLGVEGLDGIVLDLGVSSHQIDDPARGFSYMQEDAPLDMRMDPDAPYSAADIVNTYSGDELIRILKDYGEERFAARIAAGIIRERDKKRIETAGELNRIIREAIPKKALVSGSHPSKRTYQALRIECNRELTVLSESIEDMIDHLNPGGRIAIITFHSLEDRIVKQAFKKAQDPCTCPPDFPVCVCGKKPKGQIITRKPILPTEEEVYKNSRAKSAKLRVFERA
ncbi:MAG: 16S rRNA (cytosine(1402)-N(4))-methyltransferase RsmH [Lachnospiraceae bacterium]|nr:16S rRNA (cytosine(1402)-N(4))-methyltransferase RsmH [Lachnospiraceae bacterium]